MIDKRLRGLWDNLQGKKPSFRHFLSDVSLHGIRGINDLRVVFDYPVSVIAGGNASGKSTVLSAAACAYRVPGAGIKDFVPSTLFPDYRPKLGNHADHKSTVELEFNYMIPEGRAYMRWRRSQSWNRSFGGRKNASQPERDVYLRTLSNLSHPSEVRSLLTTFRLNSVQHTIPLTASQIEFSQRMLPFKYREVVKLSSGSKNLMFASQEGGAAYSELHMAAGERSILRMSQDIAQRKGALILIDEVETGLHPWVQQLLMLHLQQLALRNELQIIVTSHSPVVLDSVPSNGKIFLERDDEGRVSLHHSAYRDVIQDALYGRSTDTLNLLCEDETAEAILQGILDDLRPKLGLRGETVRIGRNAGADEFPTHAAAFKKFGQVENFVFVLDGDKRNNNVVDKIREAAGSNRPILFLPGHEAPEVWVWERLKENPEIFSNELGGFPLSELTNRLDAVYNSASDSSSAIAKSKLQSLSEQMNHTAPEICRIVTRLETANDVSEIQRLREFLEEAISEWRNKLE